jgi:hypothetical protein
MSADSEKERQWLLERYASMPTEQLRQIASESGSLTDVARELLKEEINRRGDVSSPELFSNQTATQEDEGEPSTHKLVTVRRFRDLPEALLAKGALEAADVECFLADENMVRMDWFISNLLGGVKLLVREEDAADATAVLDQPIPETFDVEGVGEYQQPHCPKCNSMDTSFDELNKAVAYGSAWMSLPLPLHNKGWNCRTCGHRWDALTEVSPTIE